MQALLLLACAGWVTATLWPQGVVHYAINKKDYDIHSQDVIMDTLSRMQQEICIKFFNTPGNFTASATTKILFISNPFKLKECPPQQYNFHKPVIDMSIGYRCLDTKNITRIVVDMLKASIQQTTSTINSFDLTKKFRNWLDSDPRATMISPADRNYLNGHYFLECGSLAHLPSARRFAAEEGGGLSPENLDFYKGMVWPLGVVMYAVHPNIAPDDKSLEAVLRAMKMIELHSCVVFQPLPPQEHLEARNFLWLGLEGEELPALGFTQGNQSLKLSSLAAGAPGHAAHTLHALLRALGVPMMSNRFDRDNYVIINWKHVKPGKEQYLERLPEPAWIRHMPYDMASATHAPANYMCRECRQPLASRTVEPLQDHLWERTLSMGRRAALSPSDVELLALLYAQECRSRLVGDGS